MKDSLRTKKQLIKELIELRRQAVSHEKSKARLKQLNQKLKKSEEKFQFLVQNADEIIYIVDTRKDPLKGQLSFVSDKVQNILGYQAEEFLRKPGLWVKLIHPDDSASALESTYTIIKDKKETIRFYRLRHKNSKGYRYFEDRVSPILDNRNNVVGFFGAARDITEGKQTEDALKQSKEILAKAQAIAHMGSWEWDIMTNKVIWSDEVYNVYGVNPHTFEPTYEVTVETMHPDDRKEFIEAIHYVLDGVRPFEMDYRLFRPDGTERVVHTIGKVTDRDDTGKPLRMVGTVHDITQRKKAEKALDFIYQGFKELLNSIDALVYVSDMKTNNILFINKYGREIWGDVEGQTCWQVLQKGQASPCSFCTNDRLIDSEGKPSGVVIWEFQNTVSGRWFECRDRAIYWPDGRVVRMEVATDITGRKAAERLLKESEERYRTLAESSPDCVFIIGKDLRLRYVNQAATRLFRSTAETLEGKSIQELFPPELFDYQNEVLQHVFNSNEPFSENSVQEFPSGKIWMNTKLVPLMDNNGQVNSILGISRDITEQKKAEDKLKKSEKKYSDIINNTLVGVYSTSLKGDILFVNAALTKMFGFESPEEMMARNVLAIYKDPKQREVFIDMLKKEGKVSNFEIEAWTKTGNSKNLLLSATLDNDVISGMIMDITERKKTEEELKRVTEEIEAWNRELEARVKEKTRELEQSKEQLIQSEKLSAMGRLTAGLAHELNSPLAGLLPLLEKYRDGAERDSEAYKEMTLMLKATEYMAKTVRDFGSFARVSEGKFVSLDMNEVIESILSFTAEQIGRKGVQITKHFADKLPAVEGDKVQLQQVVLNMITNANDAMNQDGILIINTHISQDKRHVVMEFIDNGVGITKQDLGRIFEPFFTTKKQGEGIGLGLSTSYGIIRNHKGEISVESEPGKGSKFIILLPAAIQAGRHNT